MCRRFVTERRYDAFRSSRLWRLLGDQLAAAVRISRSPQLERRATRDSSGFIRRPAVAALFAEPAPSVQGNGFVAAPDTGDLLVDVHDVLLLLHGVVSQRRHS